MRQLTAIYLQQTTSWSCECRCRCRIHLLQCLRSNLHPILYHLATCILQQVLKIFVGAVIVVLVLVLVVVVVWCFFDTYEILGHRCLSFCRFRNLDWILLQKETQRQKLTVRVSGPSWSSRVNLYKPAVGAMLVLIRLKFSSSQVLFSFFRIK